MSALRKARNVMENLASTSSTQNELHMVLFALKAKKVDFSKVVAMIDNMSKQLAKEQTDDDNQKNFCVKDFEESADDKKATEEAIAASAASIAEMSDASATLASEIDTLQDEIKDLDKVVAEATEQRKTEHSEFLTFQTQNNAATQLIEKAKNRLNKFYRPNLYKEAPKRELTDEEKILASSGRSDLIATDAPQMIAGTTQSVYVQMADSITTKEAAKADLDEKVESTKELKRSQEAELMNTNGYIMQLHQQCDFLVANYDLRKA